LGPFPSIIQLSAIAPFLVVKERGACAFLLSYWYFFGNFDRSAEIQTVEQAKIMVNPQTLITPRHGLLLVVSSWFPRVLSSPFLPESRFFCEFRDSGVKLTARN
jgi:hypothetical protein